MLSIVIPAYNETENILITIADIRQALIRSGHGSVEFIVVDDHSNEPMYEYLVSGNMSDIHCIRLSRRSGSHIALRAGLAAAKGDAVLCISADGQEDPTAIPLMLEKWYGGAHVVWGLRRERCGESFLQKTFSLLFYRLLTLMTGCSKNGTDLSRADFYLLDRKVVDAINTLQENNSSLFGLVAWIGYEQTSVEYHRRARLSGCSKWKFRSRMRLAKDWIIAFSGLPLKLMTGLGFSVACMGLFFAVFIAVKTILIGTPVQGWASTMIVILLLGGLQMAMLGVVGEYLWRTLEESRQRALYFVEKSTLPHPVGRTTRSL
jgi:dolichol-phosphate mannosyltransferase